MEFYEFRNLLGAVLSARSLYGGGDARLLARDSATAFDAGDRFDFEYPSSGKLVLDEDLCTLPFDPLFLRVRSNGIGYAPRTCFFSATQKTDGIHITAWERAENGDLAAHAIGMRGRECWGLPGVQFDPERDPVWALLLGAFLTLLNQPDQRIQTHIPSLKLNKKREKRGDPPLVIYKTLKVLKPRVVHVPLPPEEKGSHASPRVHTRRAHYRNYESGKRVLVKAHVVGDKERGMILKDYKVSSNDEIARTKH